MQLTVAVCTWNRADLLARTLDGFCRLVPPAGGWELVVVANNCSDHTHAVLDRFRARLPLVTADEPRQGHSHARNTAVKLARGGLLLWTDDDVRVPADWAQQYVAAVERFPEAAAFGGPVRPWWEAPPPAWVARNLGWLGRCWALLDHGAAVRKLDVAGGEKIFGANMGFRTPVLRRYPYDPGLGRVGRRLTSADDTRVVENMVRDGFPAVWVGTAPVEHYIGRDRVTPTWVEDIYRWQAFLESRHLLDGPGVLLGVPRWVWRWHLASVATELVRRPVKDDRWLTARIDRGKSRGVIDAARQRRAGG